ncbi:RAB7A-interacting MON1-CCZ1 complex subunit 1-like [Watersipora subatra]|uniref:RAB7A-interacting MON1-CCZ1 complex subunit 1-like n=1 Tax=Watersipora subatra TaxID=2589382 RepID=UPI00355B965E
METVNCEHVDERVQRILSLIDSKPDYLTCRQSAEILSKTIKEGSKLQQTVAETAKSATASVAIIFDLVQMLLNFSYAIELKLVDDLTERFEERLWLPFNGVLEYLDEVLQLLNPVKKPLVADGDLEAMSKLKELLECTYWRKGALHYMLCHTIYHQSQPFSDLSQKDRFVEHCAQGVVYLTTDMRKVRETDLSQEYDCNDTQLLELIKQGIFSDTHMLAVMYSAEMCYWLHLLGDSSKRSQFGGLDACTMAQQLANQYISIAEGPLRSANWNTSLAHTILESCQTSL